MFLLTLMRESALPLDDLGVGRRRDSSGGAVLRAQLSNLRQNPNGAQFHLCDAAEKLTPTFENFYDDCHFNTAGARRMGQIVSECFQDIVAN